MIPLGLCRLLHAAHQDHGTMPPNVLGVLHVQLWEWRKGRELYTFPHLPGQQRLPTRFNSLWAGVRDIREVLQRVAAFLCEMQRTTLNDFNASKVCFEKTECVVRELNNTLAALLPVA